MKVTRYGRASPRKQWNRVRAGVTDAIRQIETAEGGPDTLVRDPFFGNHAMLIWFFGPERLRKWEALKVVEAINDFFTVYKDIPREFDARIILRRLPGPVSMELSLKAELPDRWREDLPWYFNFEPWRFDMKFYEYGRSITDRYTTSVVRVALARFITQFINEGPREGLVSKEVYDHAFVKLYIRPPTPGETKVTRAEMIEVVESIREFFFAPYNWDPREFKARLESWNYRPDDEVLGTIALVLDDRHWVTPRIHAV